MKSAALTASIQGTVCTVQRVNSGASLLQDVARAAASDLYVHALVIGTFLL